MSKFFYVYQNKTFYEEARGGFLWSPQFTQDGRSHPGYECMKEVRNGDFVFHSYQSAIVAVSRAKSDCYSSRNPGLGFDVWAKEGWRVDAQYLLLDTPWIVLERDKVAMYKIQPSNGPFLPNGRGKQQYLCNVNIQLFEYLIEKILKAQTTEKSRERVKAFIDYHPPQSIELQAVADGCKIDAIIVGQNKKATLTINVEKIPNQKNWIGKRVGDVLQTTSVNLSYRVERIYRE